MFMRNYIFYACYNGKRTFFSVLYMTFPCLFQIYFYSSFFVFFYKNGLFECSLLSDSHVKLAMIVFSLQVNTLFFFSGSPYQTQWFFLLVYFLQIQKKYNHTLK